MRIFREGLTALNWASLSNHVACIEALQNEGGRQYSGQVRLFPFCVQRKNVELLLVSWTVLQGVCDRRLGVN